MRALKLASALGATAFMLCVLTSASDAQQRARQRAPLIRVYSTSGADVINTSTYVEPQIRVSEDAYVFAVAMDLDGQIQVLHPDFPGLSVKLNARSLMRLPNFFAGFNQAVPAGGVYSTAQFQRYSAYGGYMDTRGTVLALASRAPFNLERLESGGDWNISAIRQLIENRSPQAAMSMLADYIGAKDEPIGRDFMRFAGGATNRYAYDYNYYSPCDFYYGYFYAPGFGFAQLQSVSRFGRARAAGQQARIIGYDLCGVPIISYGPVVATRFPAPGTPRGQGDTTVFPKAHIPRAGTPRHPIDAAAEGVFPLPRRAGVGQMGDVTITAPTSRRGEPREILEGYRAQPGTMAVPQGRMPIDRSVPSRAPTAATGAQPVREYHPEPRVESPPPARVPDRSPAPAPAPVVHERPSTPAPPPPRAETPPTKTPPSRQ